MNLATNSSNPSIQKSIARHRAKNSKDYRQAYSRTDEIKFVDFRGKRTKTVQKPSSQRNSRLQGMARLSQKLPMRLAWVALFFIILRLIFVERGVIDYFQKETHLKEEASILKNIKDENLAIQMEIQKMQQDRAYQKKILRKQLGVIDSDEYIVLFAREKVSMTK